jgi:hypothetical protein
MMGPFVFARVPIKNSRTPFPLPGLENYAALGDGEGYHIPPLKLSITLANSFLMLLDSFYFILFVFLLNKT